VQFETPILGPQIGKIPQTQKWAPDPNTKWVQFKKM